MIFLYVFRKYSHKSIHNFFNEQTRGNSWALESEVIKFLKVAKDALYHAVKRFKYFCTSEYRPWSKRPSIARSTKINKTVSKK